MLIRRAVLDGIVAGRIDLQFRRWRRPTVKAGGKLRTAVGELAVGRVDAITAKQITVERRGSCRLHVACRPAPRPGLVSGRRPAVPHRGAARGPGSARRAARAATILTDDEIAELSRRLARYDAASPHGPWTMETLRAHRSAVRRRWRPTSPRASVGRRRRSRPTCASSRSWASPRASRSDTGCRRAAAPSSTGIERLTAERTSDWGVSVVDTGLDSRAVSFENPTGERGAGGTAAGGRKGAPRAGVRAGERVVLADLEGPGIDPPRLDDVPAGAARRHARGLARGVLRRRDRAERLGAVPRLLRRCRTAARLPYASALTTMPEGRGLQRLLPDAVPRAHARRADERIVATRSSSTTRSTTRCSASLPADVGFLHCVVPPREPDDDGARLRHRRRAGGSGPLPRLRGRRPRRSTTARGTARAR